MSSSHPLRSSLKKNFNYEIASKLSSSTNRQSTNRTPRVFHKKDASISTYEAFWNIYFDVLPGKAIEEVRNFFQLIIITLKLIDESSTITQYFQTLQRYYYGYVAPSSIVLAYAESLPRFSSKISLFFPSFRPKKSKSCARFHFLHSESLEDIIDDLRDQLSAWNFSICKKALQHWDTCNTGWIVYFDPKNDPKELTIFLYKPVKK